MTVPQACTALRMPTRCGRLLLLVPLLVVALNVWWGGWRPPLDVPAGRPLLHREDSADTARIISQAVWQASKLDPSQPISQQPPINGPRSSTRPPYNQRPGPTGPQLFTQLSTKQPQPHGGSTPSPRPTASRQSSEKSPNPIPQPSLKHHKPNESSSPQPVPGIHTAALQSTTKASWSSQIVRLPPKSIPEKSLKPDGTRTILFWNKFYNNADFYVGYGKKPFIGCPQSNCATTSNRSHLAQADAVLFHMLNAVLPLPARLPHHRFVFFLKEPPMLAHIRSPKYRGVFNLTMTYRRDSDVVNDYFSTLSGAELTPLPDIGKRSKPVAWIVSHCETPSGRELYVDELQRYIDVDIYGKCGTLKCPTKAHGGKNRYECYRTVAKHYHFYLAFENSQCRHYATEKLSLPLRYGMVPVVLGDSRQLYERIAPPGSFIHISDFAGPQELAEHLHYLMSNRTAYQRYFQWRSRYHVVDGTGWCRLCSYLHEQHAPQYYDDMGSWWMDGGACNYDTVIPEPPTGDETAAARAGSGGAA